MPAMSFPWSRLVRAFSGALTRVHSNTTTLASPSDRRKIGLALGGDSRAAWPTSVCLRC